MKKNPPAKIHRGFMALESLGVLLIILLASLFAAEKVSDYLQEKEWSVMAVHATAFNEAAKNYIADHTDALLLAGHTRITSSLLINTGYLQAGFSAENSFGQTYLTGVVKNTLRNKLQALTCTTGGTAISPRGLRSISTQIHGLGGYVNEDNVATGAYGGWSSNTGNFGISCTTGHIAIALSSEVLGTAMQESDRLYRYRVNGRPDLNRMHTDIDMHNHSVNAADTLNARTGRFSEDVIARGWLNETHGGGLYMDDSDWIKSVNGKGIYTTGKLRAGLLQIDTIVAAGSSCSVNGLVGRDNLGALLSCQSGRWQTAGSGGSISRAATNHLAFIAQESYSMMTVSVASKFNPNDRGHTASAIFNVTVNGKKIGTITNTMNVQKGGDRGHYWGYQTSSVSHRMYQYKIQSGDKIQVNFVKGYLHHSSDIQVSLTN
jgi:hypothetical protein